MRYATQIFEEQEDLKPKVRKLSTLKNLEKRLKGKGHDAEYLKSQIEELENQISETRKGIK